VNKEEFPLDPGRASFVDWRIAPAGDRDQASLIFWGTDFRRGQKTAFPNQPPEKNRFCYFLSHVKSLPL